MKKFLVLVAVLAAAGSLAVQAQQNPDAKAAPNVTGKWVMTLDMSMGTATTALDLKQAADKVTGTYTGRYGTFPLEGKLKDLAIDFTVTMTAEGQSLSLTFTGEISADGQTMKGKADMGELGEATWSARKDKAARSVS
jgi:hypothetical protein